jgi:hypothetical protein
MSISGLALFVHFAKSADPTADADAIALAIARNRSYLEAARQHEMYATDSARNAEFYANMIKDHVDNTEEYAGYAHLHANDADAAVVAAVHHAYYARLFVIEHMRRSEIHYQDTSAADAAADATDAADGDAIITNANQQAEIAKHHAITARQRAIKKANIAKYHQTS